MKIISRKFHAVLDYLSAVALIVSPWALKFNESKSASAIAIIGGIMIFIMSITTDYEGGILRSISMRMHLNIDLMFGVLLAASPWLFGFKNEVYVPHLAVGLLAIIASTLTVRKSLSTERQYRPRY
jgi:Ca2+/Na+ antiporter